MSYFLAPLSSGWHVDEVIKSQENHMTVLRFGHNWDMQCMTMDDTLYSVVEKCAVAYYATKDRNDHSAWHIPTGIQLIWAFILTVSVLWLPESPRFLIKKGPDSADTAKALACLMSLKPTNPEIKVELNNICASQSSYANCFTASHKKIALRTLSGIFIQAWQQLTSIAFIFYCKL